MENELQHMHPGEEVHQAQSAELSTGIVGLFDAPHAANEAVEVLLKLGYHPNDIGILISEASKQRFMAPSLLTHPVDLSDAAVEHQQDQEPAEKPGTSAVLQGAGAASAFGALGGLLLGAGAAVVAPGLGLLLLGPLAGLGAGFGAYIGGVYAVPTIANKQVDLMAQYETAVLEGKVLVHVNARDDADEAHIRREWQRIQGTTGSAAHEG